jgi:hypothetical protein
MISYNELGHIKALNFAEFPKTETNIFKEFFNWENIPDFAIITGVNGSGKTQLINNIFGSMDIDKKNSSLCLPANYEISGWAAVTSNNTIGGEALFLKREKYEQFVTEIFDEISNKKQAVVVGVSKLHQKVIAALNKEPNVTRDLVKEFVVRIFNYESCELRSTEPLSFLATIFKCYEEGNEMLKEQAGNTTELLSLYEWYNKIKEFKAINDSDKGLSTFLKSYGDAKFRDNVLDEYVNAKRSSPQEKINSLLDKYHFKYKIVFEKTNQDVRLKLKDGNTEISADKLSSGELMMLSMMTWLYRVNGCSSDSNNTILDNEVKIMLLDEPDKHLDPKLCKLFYTIVYEEFVKKCNIQVIMTTHRIDTVALVPNGDPRVGIYTIRHQNQPPNIEKVHKLLAMFRMSKNLREIIDYHHKVYTESTDDALFYEGVYASLKSFCDKVREQNVNLTGKDKYSWQIGTDNFRLLSNRYAMSFYSVSKKNDKGNLKSDGGCDSVINRTNRDNKLINTIREDNTAFENLFGNEKKSESTENVLSMRWHKTRKLLDHPVFYRSYGIVDHDYSSPVSDDGHDKGQIEEVTKQQITKTGRHSLDNYLADPIIFCSILDKNEIERAININSITQSLMTKKQYAKCQFNYCTSVSNNFTCLNPFYGFIPQLKESLLEINKILIKREYDRLQVEIAKYFQNLFKIMCKVRDELLKQKLAKIKNQIQSQGTKGQKQSIKDSKKACDNDPGNDIYVSMKDKAGDKKILCDHDIKFIKVKIDQNEKKEAKEETFTVKYPKEILEIRGHDISDIFGELPSQIVQRVYSNGLRYIPLDLAEMFFDLNEKIRRDINAVIKPDKNQNNQSATVIKTNNNAVKFGLSSNSSSISVSTGSSLNRHMLFSDVVTQNDGKDSVKITKSIILGPK